MAPGALGLSHSSSCWDSGIAVSAWLCSGSPAESASIVVLGTGIVVLLGAGAATAESASIVVLLGTGIVGLLGTGIGAAEDCESRRRIIAGIGMMG